MGIFSIPIAAHFQHFLSYGISGEGRGFIGYIGHDIYLMNGYILVI